MILILDDLIDWPWSGSRNALRTKLVFRSRVWSMRSINGLVARVLAKQSRKKELKDGRTLTRGRLINSAN